jgi:hypothetical protein
MTATVKREHRLDAREGRFNGTFCMTLVHKESGHRSIPIRPVDVSKRGLGFFSKEPLTIGGFYLLVIAQRQYRVELAYCGNHLGIEDLFRCGLFLRESDGDLLQLCQAAGLLTDEQQP